MVKSMVSDDTVARLVENVYGYYKYNSFNALEKAMNGVTFVECMFKGYSLRKSAEIVGVTGGEHRMKLPNGVTGFYNSEANKPPKVEEKQFKQLCFDIVTRNGGKVIGFNTSQSLTNFYYAQVEILGNRLYILLNEHYPYLTFASAVEFGDIKFIDNPFLYEHFAPFYQIIGTEELKSPFNQNMVKKADLNSAELEQIAYWKPETVGQIIFNFWD